MNRPRNRRSPDVVIVGGGIMGCACAWALATRRRKVVVLERSVPGAEASSAAAGILGAQVEATEPGPMTDLALASRSLYRKWTARLERETGVSVGFHRSGVLRVAPTPRGAARLAKEIAWQKRRRLPVRVVGAQRARALEPALGRVGGGVLFPEDATIDPPSLLRALHVAALKAGAEFRTGSYVERVEVRGGRATAVVLDGGTRVAAGHFVVAAGSWTTLIEGLDLPPRAVTPARGQIVLLESAAPVLERVVFGPRCYLVPRRDGRTLVGSTLEFVGYRREVTAGAVRDLLTAAIELCPALGCASMRDAWSNFRPYTDDALPILGPAGVEGLTLATGHYRNGILLAPITASIVKALVSRSRLPTAIEAFSPNRRIGLDSPSSGAEQPRRIYSPP